MTSLARIAATAAAAFLFVASPAWTPARADGDVTASHAWARASAPNARNGAAYLTVSNAGSEPDRIVAASTPIAEKAELHTHLMDEGVMKMRPVDGIEVAPGEPAVLRPGGLHIMMLGLKQPLAEGSHFPVTLTLTRAGSVTVDVAVLGAAAMGPEGMGAGMGAGGMDHNAMHQQHMNQMQQNMHQPMHGTTNGQ